ncbi:hypothetical protein [Roseateles noduli]|uniref:hypothetical protein n=1 Tax=Roseateles noduli TaxID=2052484 RepID=UPI003D65711D
MTPHLSMLRDVGQDSEPHEDELELVVACAYAAADGELKWGPQYRMSATRSHVERTLDWEVIEFNPDFQRVGRGSLSLRSISQEPIICLAARGAEALWGKSKDGVPCERPIHYAQVEVRYGEEAVAKFTAKRDRRTWVCEAWSFREHLRLEELRVISGAEQPIAHLVLLLFMRLAFGGDAPPTLLPDSPTVALPRPWQKVGSVPSQESLDRLSIFNHWGS